MNVALIKAKEIYLSKNVLIKVPAYFIDLKKIQRYYLNRRGDLSISE